jgi:DNA polymerase III delta prime subunit
MNREDFLWVEKYRPKCIEKTILPPALRETFQQFVDQGNIPNLILTGKAGVGKTTVARAMLEELQCDYLIINGSMNGNIDTLRNEIKEFASAISFSGNRKYVILDEADYLNPQSTQPALRNFMEEFSKNCGFILTCNYINRIIEPLHSRCSIINFKVEKDDRAWVGAQFYKLASSILEMEGVPFDDKVVAQVVLKYFPDFRRTLNELQKYSVTGKIDTGILVNFSEERIKDLVQLLKKKNFTEVRKWVAENNDVDQTVFFRKLYDVVSDSLKPTSIPQLVLTISDYQYKAAFVADHEINILACLIEIMAEGDFK